MTHRSATAAILTAAILLTACGGSSDTGSTQPSRQFLSIGTAPPGGAFFVVGSALGEVLNEIKGAEGWQVNAEATAGTQENIRRLHSGELDFALANSAITYFSVRGEEGWDQAYPMRTVMTLAPNVALFVSPRRNGIQSIPDLKGKRVVVGPPGAGFEYFIRPLLSAHGMSYEDFTPLNNSQSGAVDLLADGSADAAFLGGAVPTASLTQASSSQDLVFIPYQDEPKQQVLRDYPFFAPATIPAGTYRGLDADYQGLNVGSMHLITSAGQDEELVYQVAKSLYENRQMVVEKHAAGRAINPNVVIRDTGTAFHPGAIRFYKEIRIWPQE